jgi:hypothetical protein
MRCSPCHTCRTLISKYSKLKTRRRRIELTIMLWPHKEEINLKEFTVGEILEMLVHFLRRNNRRSREWAHSTWRRSGLSTLWVSLKTQICSILNQVLCHHITWRIQWVHNSEVLKFLNRPRSHLLNMSSISSSNNNSCNNNNINNSCKRVTTITTRNNQILSDVLKLNKWKIEMSSGLWNFGNWNEHSD